MNISKYTKVLWIGLLLFSLFSTAQAITLSRTIKAGVLDMISVPLVVSGGNTVSNIFRSAAPGSILSFWNSTTQGWDTVTNTITGWPDGDRQVPPTESFFFSPSTTQTLVMVGTAPDLPISIPISPGPNFNFPANPSPVNMLWADIQLSAELPNGSSVFFWDKEGQKWTASFLSLIGWPTNTAQHVVLAGDGFCVTTPEGAAPFTWSAGAFKIKSASTSSPSVPGQLPLAFPAGYSLQSVYGADALLPAGDWNWQPLTEGTNYTVENDVVTILTTGENDADKKIIRFGLEPSP